MLDVYVFRVIRCTKTKNLRRNKRLRYARIRTLVILVLIAVGSVAFFYTNGKGKNEETPANLLISSATSSSIRITSDINFSLSLQNFSSESIFLS